jgi:AcrR family transcriptional regulator
MTTRPNAPVSRRERPAKAALSRDGIVAAAVAVLRAEGLEKVTMRRLAQELDTGPASLYVYVANTAELHAAVLDELLGEVDLDLDTGDLDTDWRDQLEGVLTSYKQILFAHPALARMAVSARPRGEHYLRLVERLIALQVDGGVPPERAAWGVDVLLLVATAAAAEKATQRQSADAESEWDALTQAIRELPASTHPYLHALSTSVLGGSPGERASWVLRVVINGITTTPVPGTES